MHEKEYVNLVNTINDTELSEDLRRKTLEELIRLYRAHIQENREEAMRYAKGAVLHLFKQGKLRGMTEHLEGLKPIYLEIMMEITHEDIEKYKFSDEERHAFMHLKDKLKQEMKFTAYSNERVNEISTEGVNSDDDVYDLKPK